MNVDLDQTIAGWIEQGSEIHEDQFFAHFTTDGGSRYIDAEGQYWDFKQEWPFSHSDSYFLGIARLVSAFANSGGGLIIFGVHDKKRTGGHNKVLVNLDRFIKAVSQCLSEKPSMSVRSFRSEAAGDVDVLTVLPRSVQSSPVRLERSYGSSPSGTLWVRSGHEVVSAAPEHFPTLFCRRKYSQAFDVKSGVEGSLPPSPAKLRRFVGRTTVLDRLFGWLEHSDEPRTYLHGKGGSGKTTIAYEFSRLIRDHGSNLRIQGADPIDAVIFVSAKEKELVTFTGEISVIRDVDFSNEEELLRKILLFSGWSSDEEAIANLDRDGLRRELKEYFNIASAVIVIDDIDTLTTKGVDAGADFLYRTLCRSTKQSRVLYTLRNAPTQSLMNAIEVPGLEDGDYEEFVSECAAEFRVKEPAPAFRDVTLAKISERRPLVVESVIALSRTAGSYERAAELFEQHAGDNIRDYIFSREWDALPAGNMPRMLLAALSEFEKPVSFSDIQAALQADPSAIMDAIYATREMFLTIDDTGPESLYSLAPLTKSFVKQRTSALVGFGILRERVKNFKRTASISNPRVANITSKVERLLPRRLAEHLPDRAHEAVRIITDRNLPPLVTEDPMFRSLCGYVYASLPTPRLPDCRAAFDYAQSMRLEPEFAYLNAWYNAEKNSGAHDGFAIKIADIVLQGRRYSPAEKLRMLSCKATSLYARGKDRLLTDPVDGMKDLKEALILHLRAHKLNMGSSAYHSERSATYARNTAFQLLTPLASGEAPWEALDTIREIASIPELFLDPVREPFSQTILKIASSTYRSEAAGRTRARAKGLGNVVLADEKWIEEAEKSSLRTAVVALERLVSQSPHAAFTNPSSTRF